MKTAYLFSVIGFAVLATGCGNLNNKMAVPASTSPYASNSSSGTSGSTTDPNEEPGYNCPTDVNVYPPEALKSDSEGNYQFRVCKSQTSLSAFVAKGRTSLSQSICVIPAHVSKAQKANESDQILPWVDTNGIPYSKCFRVTDDRAKVAFPDTVKPDALFIVDGLDDLSMKSCLQAHNPLLCPVFAYGTL